MPIIYKYLSPDRVTFFADGLLRMTQPGDLNDPFECISFFADFDPVKYAETQLANYLTTQERRFAVTLDPHQVQRSRQEYLTRAALPITKLNWFNDCYTSFLRHLNLTLGVVSFSLNSTSSTMWGHYSDGHRGFCLGFELGNYYIPAEGNTITYGTPYSVIYQPERIPCKLLEGAPIESRCFFIKSNDWAYEEEVRLLYSIGDADERRPNCDNRKLLICLKRFPFEKVKEILIGYYAADELRAQIIAFAKTHQISVYEMKLSSSPDFKMEKRQIL